MNTTGQVTQDYLLGTFMMKFIKNIPLSALEIDKPEPSTPLASDIEIENHLPESALTEACRILRDTALARRIKEIHNYVCQMCNIEPIQLPNGKFFCGSASPYATWKAWRSGC